MNTTSIFEIELRGLTVVLTPQHDPDELSFHEEVEVEVRDVFDRLSAGQSQHVVVDCCRIDRCCSSAIAFFIRLSKSVQAARGQMVFCNVSAHLREVFEMLHLDTLWATSGSLEDAITKTGGPTATN